MTEKERMLAGKLYHPGRVEDGTWEKSREILEKFNGLPYQKFEEGVFLLKEIFGRLEEDAVIVPPFYCDKGPQIRIGKHFYANTGLVILDEAPVTIGDHVFLGPGVAIYTACHPVDAAVRRMDLEYAKPVTIGDDVWIGGNVTLNPGVTIGCNVVIGSGSVVTRDIPDGVVAAGNPCRVIRKITDEDAKYWERELAEYEADADIKKDLSFRYDTQLLIEGEDLDEEEIGAYFAGHFQGDCLLVVGDEELIKIHFHTNEPWDVLAYCSSLGEIHDIVVEDMERQARGLKG